MSDTPNADALQQEGIEIRVNKKGEFDGIMKDGVEVQPGSDEYNQIIERRDVKEAWNEVSGLSIGDVGYIEDVNFDDITTLSSTELINKTIDYETQEMESTIDNMPEGTNSVTITETTNSSVSGHYDQNTNQAYINGKPVGAEEYNKFTRMTENEKLNVYGEGKPITSIEYGSEIKTDNPIITEDKDGNVRDHKVFFDEEQGTTIRPVDDDGNLLPNNTPIYTDGVFDETQITKNDTGVKSETQFDDEDLERVNEDVKKNTREHINRTNPSFVKPAWLKKAEEISISGLKNMNKFTKPLFTKEFWFGKENYPTSGTNAGSGGGVDGASGQGLRAMNATLKAFAGAEEEDTLFKKIVKYPMDMSANMDHMFIQCYSYRAPYAKTFDGKYGDGLLRKDRESGLAFGAERYTAYKTKLGAGIKLPMPNNIQDGNGRSWNEESMTNQQMSGAQIAGKNIISNILTGNLFGTSPTINKYAQQADLLTQESTRGMVAAEKIAQLAADTGLSAEQIMQRSVGVVANSNTELLFAGVVLRSFEYQWRMSPRNRLEAANVRMIIRAFKQWSAPKKTRKVDRGGRTNVGKAGGPSFFLGTPNIFRLRFVTNGNRSILGVNKFKPCALTNIDLNYTAEGQWLAYEEGMPVAIDMTLRFAELEPIYDTDYSEDVAEDRRYDPSDPNSTGDLYPISKVDQSSPYGTDIGY